MQVSIVIPVWYGEEVIGQCLTAVTQHATPALQEIICVDNGSPDGAAALIAAQFPQVRLQPQPVNLGFAGGVNAGMQAAQGDVFLLLNQDCLVHEGWLTAVAETFSQHPTAGIVGGTLYNADGSVNHAGAVIQKPGGYGEHLTAVPADGIAQPADYVTGALFALRRTVWEQVGPLDEDFYPAYYEECDYCYRARHNGFGVFYAPALTGTHLFSSRQWQKDPVRHTIQQHRARYRFICKHFSAADLPAFFQAETAAIAADTYHDQTIGRLVAARYTVRSLPEIIASRQRDLGATTPAAHARQLSIGFAELAQSAWRKWQKYAEVDDMIATSHHALQASRHTLETYQQQEIDLLTRLYFRHPIQPMPESGLQRWWRLLVKRPLSILTLRDYFLQARLNTLHVARMDQISHIQQLSELLIGQQGRQQAHRLRLLETLNEYEQDG
jgi:GT2 family glycosyltransferase